MKALVLAAYVLAAVMVSPAVANDMPSNPPSDSQQQQQQPTSARQRWVHKRIHVLQENHESFKAARFSARLGGYRDDGFPVPYRPTEADKEAYRNYVALKRQHEIDQFELRALRRELQRRH